MTPPSGTFDNDWAEAKPSVMFRRLSASRRYNQGEWREEAVTNCHIDCKPWNLKGRLALCLVDIKLSSFNPSQNNLHDAGKKSMMQD